MSKVDIMEIEKIDRDRKTGDNMDGEKRAEEKLGMRKVDVFNLKDYFKKPCLMALSLYGNNLRKGHSIIIFLLNERLNRVISIEKIRLENLVLRHFVTNSKNELYEDTNGDIFISADKEGIFRVKFTNFR